MSARNENLLGKARSVLAKELYEKFRHGKQNVKFDEEKHSLLMLEVMLDYERGTLAAFCVEAGIPDSTFYYWVHNNKWFSDLYYFAKLLARCEWEKEGFRIRSNDLPLGIQNYEFEHWKMIGWTRFGVSSKNPRIKINITPEASPIEHYREILKQASQGEFTAGELKALMESINIGMNVHEKIELQKELNELKSDLKTMQANTHVENPFSNK